MSSWVNALPILCLALPLGGLLAQSTSRGPRMGPAPGEPQRPFLPGSKGGTPRVPDFSIEVPQNTETRKFFLKENEATGDLPGKGVPIFRMDERSCVRKETARIPPGAPVVLTEFKRCGDTVYYLFSTEKQNNMTIQKWVSGRYLEER